MQESALTARIESNTLSTGGKHLAHSPPGGFAGAYSGGDEGAVIVYLGVPAVQLLHRKKKNGKKTRGFGCPASKQGRGRRRRSPTETDMTGTTRRGHASTERWQINPHAIGETENKESNKRDTQDGVKIRGQERGGGRERSGGMKGERSHFQQLVCRLHRNLKGHHEEEWHRTNEERRGGVRIKNGVP